jgi:cell division transport system permease protein
MAGLIYSCKEAFSGFSKARVSTAITIFTIFFLIFVLSIFAVLSLNVQRLINVLNAKHDLQVFISNTYSEKDISALRAKIASMDQVAVIAYISKEEASKEFRQEFGADIFSLLEENPLPASFVITLKEKFVGQDVIRQFIKRLEAENGVDEVLYQRGPIDTLLRFSRISKTVSLTVFSLVLLGSLFMVSNTLRLIIIARKSIIDTMKLVGATSCFIRRPFFIEGMLQGVMGGFAAAVILWFSLKIINWQWPGIISAPNELFAAVILAGFLFGLFGSLFAVRRYL